MNRWEVAPFAGLIHGVSPSESDVASFSGDTAGNTGRILTGTANTGRTAVVWAALQAKQTRASRARAARPNRASAIK